MLRDGKQSHDQDDFQFWHIASFSSARKFGRFWSEADIGPGFMSTQPACAAWSNAEQVTGNDNQRVLRPHQTSSPTPYFQKRVKDRPAPLDLSGLCEALRTPTPPWTPSRPRPIMPTAPDCRRRHGHSGLAAELGSREVRGDLP
jgi:hypothetical protein